MQYNNGYPMNYQQMSLQNYPQFPQSYPQQQQYVPQNPYMPQNQPQNQQVNNLPPATQNVQNSTKFDVVQGELAANMYPTDNGQEAILIDMDNPFVYHKKRGIDGKLEPMKKFRLVEVEDKPEEQKIDLSGFVKQEEIENIVEKLVREEVEKKLSEVTLKPSRRTKGDD